MDWTGMTFRTKAEDRRAESRNKVERAKRGDTVIWCETCKEFVNLPQDREYDGSCPKCGKPTFKMKCTRCGREWYPRDPKVLPGTCPGCKSPYFNKTRVRGKKEAITASPDAFAKVTERMEADETFVDDMGGA